MPYLILAQSESTAKALSLILGCADVETTALASQCLVLDQTHASRDQGVGNFQNGAARIEELIAGSGFLPVTIFVDSVEPSKMDPIEDSGSWDSVVGMLVLAFPEVNWVFGRLEGLSDVSDDYDWATNNSIPLWAGQPWRNPLLDPTGLRNGVRSLANTKRADRDLDLPLRTKVAAAIDEEVHYALFHGYTAYRFGYRAYAVTSWQLMKSLFGETSSDSGGAESEEPENSPHNVDLLLEDVNLYFPDRPQNTHLSSFEPYFDDDKKPQGRAYHCPKLGYKKGSGENSTFRIIVTSGHSDAPDEPMSGNQKFIEKYNPDGWGFVLKPTGGMFDLWDKAELFSRLRPVSEGGKGGSLEGQAFGFFWPPKPKTNGAGENAPHSAPGKLMLVSSHLVRRADALRASANTVEECIRGAVLATDALELLSYRTPTIAIQALELKHWFEVKAEVAFLGVGHHFQLTRRFKEIQSETKAAACFHNRDLRDAAALDAAVNIANRLTLIFRDAGQFDEEEKCLCKLRWWNRMLSFYRTRIPVRFKQRWWNRMLSFRRTCNPVRWLGLGLLAYAEFLISNLRWLLLSVAAWLLIITLTWWALLGGTDLAEAVHGSLSSFIANDISKHSNPFIVCLSTFSAVLGYFHLGVFISFLYSAIARK